MMAQNKRASTLRWVTALLGVVALILCIVMALHSIKGTTMIGCGAGSSCDSVLTSRWSSLLGILPVAGLAVGVYLAILICLLFVKDRELAPIVWKLLLALGGAVLGSAIWFFIIQKWILGAFCKYCMTAHSIGIVVTTLLCIQAHRNCPNKFNAAFLAIGLLCAGGMAGLQLLTTPRVSYDVGAAEETLPLLHPGDAPVLGNPDAPYVVDLMFDYQCSHCRKVHFAAKELVEQHPDIAFVLTPCPLSFACNPYIPVSSRDQFEGSCELARLALAIWLEKPEEFAEFDEWLFTPADESKGWYPRTVDSAQEHAKEIMGGEQELYKAISNAAISGLFSKSFELFGRTTQSGKSGIPRLVYKSQWIIPEVDTAEGLMDLLNQVFNIPVSD